WQARGLAAGGEDLQHRAASSSTQVENLETGSRSQPVQRQQMGVTKVVDVHVVAHASTVRSRVVVAEDLDRRAACGRAQCVGDQVGFGFVRLANLTVGTRTGSIEVAQCDGAQTVRAAIRPDDAFGVEFALTVRIDRLGGVTFSDRNLDRIAIDGGGRRKNESVDSGCAHRIEQVQRSGDVVAEVKARIRNRLAHDRPGREMHHALEWVIAECLAERGRVKQGTFDQWSPADRPTMASRQVVEGDRCVSGTREALAHVRADVSGATTYEDGGFGRHQELSPAIRRYQSTSELPQKNVIQPAMAR